MKRFLVFALVLMVAFSAVACSNGQGTVSAQKIDGSLEEIMTKIYAGVTGEFASLGNTVVTKENLVYYLGAEDLPFVEALASEPMMSSVAHSVVLVRVAPGTDIEAAKKSIKEKIDGRKWICVEVDPANILVDNVGDLVLLVMDNEKSADLVASFKALAQ